MQEMITHNGLTFSVRIESDDDATTPWDREDGHGIVSDWTARDKRPGERVLNSDWRGHKRFYDFAETLKIARADGWGLGDADRAALAKRLGRDPTQREVTAEAVERDFDRLRRWCADDWRYVGIVVTLLDVDGEETDESDSLWGVESDCDDYLAETAQELAERIADRVGDARELVKRTAIRKGA